MTDRDPIIPKRRVFKLEPPKKVDRNTIVVSEAQHAVLARVRGQRLSYGLRALLSSHGRPLLVLGEAHLKLPAAWNMGERVVDAFAERGVESARLDSLALRLLVAVTIGGPRWLLRIFSLGLIRGSTIDYARSTPRGHTTLLESATASPAPLRVGLYYIGCLFGFMFALPLAILGAAMPGPMQQLFSSLARELFPFVVFLEAHLMLTLIPAILLQRHRFAWLLNPGITILTYRNRIMADGTERLFQQRPGTDPVLVIMGRAHLPGYIRHLIERHGFTELDIN